MNRDSDDFLWPLPSEELAMIEVMGTAQKPHPAEREAETEFAFAELSVEVETFPTEFHPNPPMPAGETDWPPIVDGLNDFSSEAIGVAAEAAAWDGRPEIQPPRTPTTQRNTSDFLFWVIKSPSAALVRINRAMCSRVSFSISAVVGSVLAAVEQLLPTGARFSPPPRIAWLAAVAAVGVVAARFGLPPRISHGATTSQPSAPLSTVASSIDTFGPLVATPVRAAMMPSVLLSTANAAAVPSGPSDRDRRNGAHFASVANRHNTAPTELARTVDVGERGSATRAETSTTTAVLDPTRIAPSAVSAASARSEPAPPVPMSVEPVRAASVTATASKTSEISEIKKTLRAYERAYERLDVRAAVAVWPTVDERALTRAFNGLKTQSLEFQNCDFDVEETTAVASCVGRARYVRKIGGQDPLVEPRSWRFRLQKIDDVWKIENGQTR